MSAEPVFGADGVVKLAINTIHDLTDRMRASEHVRLLGDTSALLAASLDFEETLVRVADLLVPGIADYALIDLVERRRRRPSRPDPPRRSGAGGAPARDQVTASRPAGNAGHPVTRVLTSGEPLLIEVADADVLRAAAVDDEHLRAVRAAAADLLHRRSLRRPRPHGRHALPRHRCVRPPLHRPRTSPSRASSAGASPSRSENARLYREASESFALLDTLLVSAPVGIGFWDRELRFVRLNDALSRPERAADRGSPRQDARGGDPARSRPASSRSTGEVLETGHPVTHEETIGTGGAERQWISSYYPVRAETGEITGVGAVIMEVTAQRRADERLRLLAEAGALFSSSLDPQEIFERVARVVVPRFAESCNIYVAQGESLERAAYAHADPELEPIVASLPQLVSDRRGLDGSHGAGLQPRQADPRPDADARVHRQPRVARRAARRLRRIGTQSMIFVPLVARGEALGVMTMGSRIPGRFDETDLELGEEIGRRAAVAIENARLYAETEARAQASQALQFVRDGVFLLDADQVVRLWNPAAERITGLAEAEMLGRPASEVLASWPLEQVGERGQTLPIEVGDARALAVAHRVRVPAGHGLRVPRPDGRTGARAAEERLRLDRLARAADAAGGHLRCGDDAAARPTCRSPTSSARACWPWSRASPSASRGS